MVSVSVMVSGKSMDQFRVWVSVLDLYQNSCFGCTLQGMYTIANLNEIRGCLYLLLSLKWRILSQTSTEQSGKNKEKLIFPTGLQVHLEDMF